jgi:D-methionine transport system permease protein
MNLTNEVLLKATYETILMTLLSTVLSYLIGIPLGVLLSATSKNGIRPNKYINVPLGLFVNLLRSIPCMLLIIILFPLTRAIVGRGTGYWYTMIIPLFFASFPFVSRMVEQSLAEVSKGEIEAVRSMGASDWQLVSKVLLSEAKPSLISGIAVSAISIIGYTSFAYDFAAGGLISTAFAYYTNNTNNYMQGPTIWVVILIVVVIVQVIQELGLFIARKTDKRRVN